MGQRVRAWIERMQRAVGNGARNLTRRRPASRRPRTQEPEVDFGESRFETRVVADGRSVDLRKAILPLTVAAVAIGSAALLVMHPPVQGVGCAMRMNRVAVHAADTTLSAAPPQHHVSPNALLETSMTTATVTTAPAAPTATPRPAIHWFEIPATDLGRAQAFYERVLATTLRREPMGAVELALFAYDEPACGGCLMAGASAPQPSTTGALVYLNAEPSLDAALARVEAAGGSIATPRVQLPGDTGAFAHIVDTEGNRVGLHAMG